MVDHAAITTPVSARRAKHGVLAVLLVAIAIAVGSFFWVTFYSPAATYRARQRVVALAEKSQRDQLAHEAAERDQAAREDATRERAASQAAERAQREARYVRRALAQLREKEITEREAAARDARLRGEIRRFEGHGDGISFAAFHPGNRCILTASRDKTARLWDAATGKELLRYSGAQSQITGATFSPDGRYFCIGSWDDASASILHTATTAKLTSFRSSWWGGQPHPISCIAFSPDGRTLATGHPAWSVASMDAPTIRVWDASSGAWSKDIASEKSSILSIAFSPDGEFVLGGSDDGGATLWNRKSGESVRRFARVGGKVWSVRFSPDGLWIATGSEDATISLWDASKGTVIRLLEGHWGAVLAVAFGPDGKQLLSGSTDGTARLWDTDTGRELRRCELATRLLWATREPNGWQRLQAYFAGEDKKWANEALQFPSTAEHARAVLTQAEEVLERADPAGKRVPAAPSMPELLIEIEARDHAEGFKEKGISDAGYYYTNIYRILCRPAHAHISAIGAESWDELRQYAAATAILCTFVLMKAVIHVASGDERRDIDDVGSEIIRLLLECKNLRYRDK